MANDESTPEITADIVSPETKGASSLTSEGRDVVAGRYEIKLSEPLSDLDTANAKAYAINDQNSSAKGELYCLICESGLPYRSEFIKQTENILHPAFPILIAHEAVYISSQAERRMVYVYGKPKGQRLSTWLTHNKLTLRTMIEHIIHPLLQTIRQMEEYKLAHGSINPGNLYYDENAKHRLSLGECLSEPPGYSQNLFYEPLTRALADPIGKGEPSPEDDYYAVGVLVIYLYLGKLPPQEMMVEQFLFERCMQGSYAVLTGGRDFPEPLDELLIGLITDNVNERWTSKHLDSWLKGKRYNLIKPHAPREAPRPYAFHDIQHFNRVALAFSLRRYWDDAIPELRQDKLERWIELSIADTDLAESVKGVLWQTGGEYAQSEQQHDELMTRTLMLLNPYAPMQFRDTRFHVNAMGWVLADIIHKQNTSLLRLFSWILSAEFGLFWSHLHSESVPGKGSYDVLQTLQQYRIFAKITGPEFGIERLLYDLNPSLPCQSPQVKRYHAQTLPELLQALEDLSAESEMRARDPVDSHIAAFIASKLMLNKNPYLGLIKYYGQKFSPSLKHMVLLSMAQKKSGPGIHRGLARWLSSRLTPVTDLIYNQETKQDVRGQIQEICDLGKISALEAVLMDEKMRKEDQKGFTRAVQKYRRNQAKLKYLSDITVIAQRADIIGARIAIALAYLILLITAAGLMRDFTG